MKIVYLGGGVGGAKLLHGLAAECEPGSLTAVINTGDDFEYWGLWICPDLDTSMYTLAGLIDPQKGWGRADEHWTVLDEMRRLGAEDWFLLGDRDLAVHIERTRRLNAGMRLTDVTARLCASLGVQTPLLPMCDHPRQTWMLLQDGRELPFQDWLVGEGGTPPVASVTYRGSDEPSPDVLRSIAEADAVIVGPSNPWVSILPITTLRGVAPLLRDRPVVAVSPIVGGRAIKGPLAEMITSMLKRPADAEAVFSLYDWLDWGVIDASDARDGTPPQRVSAPILLPDLTARRGLARQLLTLLRTNL